MKAYIPNPKTLEEHLSNCQFQLDNVKGWVMAAHEDGRDSLGAAEAKAMCLRLAAESLECAVAAERKARPAQLQEVA